VVGCAFVLGHGLGLLGLLVVMPGRGPEVEDSHPQTSPGKYGKQIANEILQELILSYRRRDLYQF